MHSFLLWSPILNVHRDRLPSLALALAEEEVEEVAVPVRREVADVVEEVGAEAAEVEVTVMAVALRTRPRILHIRRL